MDGRKNVFPQEDMERMAIEFRKLWDEMWDSFADEGIRTVNVNPGDAAPLRLALWPIQEKKCGLVIVCAGGGFFMKSANEAKPVAEAFHRAGMNAAVLDYRLMPAKKEDARDDALRAIRYLRYHADDLGIDGTHIALGGFSAGGIVTALAANGFDSGRPESEDPVERYSSRPDAVWMMYGAFTNTEMPERNIMGYSYELTGKHAATDLALMLPLNAPPAFIAQTDDDDPMQILTMAEAYARRGIKCEAHLFCGGRHGGGLFNGCDGTPNVPHTAHWITLCTEWFGLMGF